jgi:hypothetical protein
MSDAVSQSAENDAPVIERLDRYIITVNGHRIRATEGQEHALRRMDAAGVARFLTVMGCIPPGNDQ